MPLSESPFISKELGTRHRAALGISEVTDSLTIIISEETGSISVTKSGELYRNLDQETFKEMLLNELVLDKGKDNFLRNLKLKLEGEEKWINLCPVLGL